MARPFSTTSTSRPRQRQGTCDGEAQRHPPRRQRNQTSCMARFHRKIRRRPQRPCRADPDVLTSRSSDRATNIGCGAVGEAPSRCDWPMRLRRIEQEPCATPPTGPVRQSGAYRTAGDHVEIGTASVPSASRRLPSLAVDDAAVQRERRSVSVPIVAMASLTSTILPGPLLGLQQRSPIVAGSTWMPSAIRPADNVADVDGRARQGPGSRLPIWLIALNRCVTTVAPASAKAACGVAGVGMAGRG